MGRLASYACTRRLFLRLLGVVYVVAFGSLLLQIAGLVGGDGILPAGIFFEKVHDRLGADARWWLPSVCWWLGTGTPMLRALCAAGIGCGVLLACDVAPLIAAGAAWALYLSLVVAGQVFLNFQWDALLLETGLLALPLAPLRLRPRPHPGDWLPLLPLWLLVLKLHVLSGWVKIASGDPTWHDLTALRYHYWTTCLPVWLGWYADRLPLLAQQAAAAGMFAVELGAPWLIFGPRRLRHLAAVAMIGLQLAIALTGNYGFFNLLTIALCLTLLDDGALARWMPRSLPPPASAAARLPALARSLAAGVLAVLVLLPLLANVPAGRARPLVRSALAALAPLRSFNGYGLFANMTTERPEIVIEGSDDGATWRAYELPWKPGDPAKRPRFVAPYMPRLDWQMWFAALQGHRQTYWFDPLLERLLEGSPPVLALFAEVPFPSRPPRLVRAVLYRYVFASPAEHARGLWWHRELVGLYAPPRARRTP